MSPGQSSTMRRQHDYHDAVRSPLSCHQCRRLKRRCDRQYPCCALCHQNQVACDYPHRRKKRARRGDNNIPDVASPSTSHQSSRGSPADSGLRILPDRPREDNAHRQLSELGELDLLAASCLDPDNFMLTQLEAVKIDAGITKSVANLIGSVGDIQATGQFFFKTIHVWMPIVSKKQFEENLPERLAFRRPETFLLVLAMKLCSSRVVVARSMLYRTVKQFYFDVESSGMLSVQVLQAAVLIALYELGHGIYPAVILSVGNCARIGILLGIDKYLTAGEVIPGVSWIEHEERRRVWWMVLLLDRFMNLTHPQRNLVTADPDPDSYLPVDDGAWDSGLSKPEDAVKLRLSSQVHIGRFARFAHAAPLLSQAISRLDEEPHNTAQLRRTILSLIKLGETEGVTNKVLFCTLNAACFIAVFVLDNPSSRSSAENDERSAEELISPETVSALRYAVKVLSKQSFDSVAEHCDKLSPFLSHMVYKALMMCLSLKHRSSAELDFVSSIHVLKQALEQFGGRWLVAGMVEQSLPILDHIAWTSAYKAIDTYLLLAKRQEVFSLLRTP
ncbi:hypothetical protein F5884DRAFT_896830 [Xylogone sp. PMI_703]|nr:hypothetical protein F5884DRAFT_896830 [Xylogone sp. PMI_703]